MFQQRKRRFSESKLLISFSGYALCLTFGLVVFAKPIDIDTDTVRAPSLVGPAQSVVSARTYSAQGNEVRQLRTGEVFERDLSGGDVHRYQITLAENQFLQVTADQRGIDIVVTLVSPDGKRVVEMDSPNGSQGPEPVVWVTKASGNYQVEVSSLDKGAAPGRYQLKVEGLRAALPPDNDRVAAQAVFSEGIQFLVQGTAEALRQAIRKFEAALQLCRAVGDRPHEVRALTFIGSAYDLLGDYQKALDIYFPLLEIVRAIGDRFGEAQTLANIGSQYYSLGRQSKGP